MQTSIERVAVILLACLYATAVGAANHPKHKITTEQASALVMASLTAEQSRLPKVGTDFQAQDSSYFLSFTVVWEGTPSGSVVVGIYEVDSHTGDVFSATIGCYEYKNHRLEALQAQIRARLRLSRSGYQRLKTKGPLCEE